MNTIQEIKKEQQNKYTALFNSCGVFWAFSNEQFHANKTPLSEGDKYVSIGAGGYMPKSNVDAYISGSKEIKKWFTKAVKESKGARRQHIAYELANHECYYTGDWQDAIDALGSEYTAKEVYKVYCEELKKQNETQAA